MKGDQTIVVLPYPLLNTSLADFPKSLYDGGTAIGSETYGKL